ncbi:MAG: cysteine--tRNA ligase [Akkermansiaceae bacterium]|nr:cysteine--tRNA ligase [Akkermansiaceae bacterium]
MRLFDTLSRQVREVEPVDGKTFRFYCCGPTVYGPAHIGNFRSFVVQDVLRRVLELGGVKTKHVRNITDLDDKTIRDSQAAGKSLKEFTAFWTERFHADGEKLNCMVPHVEPSAVEHIPQQITMIEELIEKEHAYASGDGSVYFRISSYPDYGKLAHLDMQELKLGKTQNQRADADEYEKDSLSDFVLWKARREEDGENFWASPWGEGRPGWHLECSAMIRQYLGETFDLHSGGVDLIFPHHENEIAQSKCSCGGEFAKHWFHVTHLMVDGGKMSKSKGNLYTVDDLVEKGFSSNEVRYVLVGGHYRKPMNFTFDTLHAAQEALGKLARGEKALAEAAGVGEAPSYKELCGLEDAGIFAEAWASLNDDLNSATALGKVFTALRKSEEGDALSNWKGLHLVLAGLGVTLPDLDVTVDVPAEIQELGEQRWAARTAKEWAESDRLRDELAAKGWLVKDGKDGFELTPA